MATIAWLKVHNQDVFRRLVRALNDAGNGDLRRDLVREIRAEGQPALAATRAAWPTVDVTSSRGGGTASTGLRARIAAATKIQVQQNGIRVHVNPRQVDARYGRTLTFGMNNMGRWKHPVFGNRNYWESQYGQEVFYKTLERYEPRWRRGIERAMDRTARKLGM